MKINWFSPLSPAKTGIAAYSDYVLEELAKTNELVLWTDQVEVKESYGKIVRYRGDLTDLQWREINCADITFFNIGNNQLFHAGIFKACRQCPGIVILHDVCLHHLIAGTYLVVERNAIPYLEGIYRLYGNEGYEAAQDFMKSYRNPLEMAERFPMTELATAKALGVVVHTASGAAMVHDVPVNTLPLPYAIRHNLERRQCLAIPPFKLIVFGFINPCRRLESVIQALDKYEYRDLFHLDVVGDIHNQKEIEQMIASRGLHKLITLHGYVSDAKLDAFLADANLAINLRTPTMHEASLSQLQIWSHGLPSIVSKLGWFGELSEDVVGFVEPATEIEDLQKRLSSYIQRPDLYEEMGKQGRERLKKHSPAIYAKALIDFAQTLDKRYFALCNEYLKERCNSELVALFG